jgi:hypothetical protein
MTIAMSTMVREPKYQSETGGKIMEAIDILINAVNMTLVRNDAVW